MIQQACNVELTKVYYYDINKRSQNMSISRITRENGDKGTNDIFIIKNNIFGQRWTLKINEIEDIRKDKKFKSLKICIYGFVFFNLLLATGFGLLFSIDPNIFSTENKNTPDDGNIIKYVYLDASDASPNETLNRIGKENLQITKNNSFYCKRCSSGDICLKIEETAKPKCVTIVDQRDPTVSGCGGLCKINTEYCKKLDKLTNVFQCFPLKTLLKCPLDTFNCGDMCVAANKRCDGKNDCLDMADEKNCVCNLNTHFHCGNNTSCLENKKMCDGKVDCWDKSDETECQSNNLHNMV